MRTGEGYTDNWIDTLTDKNTSVRFTQYGNGDLNVAWIAQFHTRANYVSKVFATGREPLSDFIIETRMSKAAQLLRDTGWILGRSPGWWDIPRQLFCQGLRKQLGISPTRYLSDGL